MSYWGQRSISYVESILSDSINFFNNGRVSSTRNALSNVELQENPFLTFTPFVGLETDIFLESAYPAHWLLTPYARFYALPTTITTSIVKNVAVAGSSQTIPEQGSWSILGSVQLGIALKYRTFSLVKP